MGTLDLLFQYSDPQIFIPAIVNTIQYNNNSRVKPVLLDKLLTYIPAVRRNLASKYILPLAKKIVVDSKSDLKSTAQHIIQLIK
jgi:hypothetical protein